MEVGQEMKNRTWGSFPVQSLGATQIFKAAKFSGIRNEAIGRFSHQVKKSYQKAIFFPSFLSIANFT